MVQNAVAINASHRRLSPSPMTCRGDAPAQRNGRTDALKCAGPPRAHTAESAPGPSARNGQQVDPGGRRAAPQGPESQHRICFFRSADMTISPPALFWGVELASPHLTRGRGEYQPALNGLLLVRLLLANLFKIVDSGRNFACALTGDDPAGDARGFALGSGCAMPVRFNQKPRAVRYVRWPPTRTAG
jgi:hypothetical protein